MEIKRATKSLSLFELQKQQLKEIGLYLRQCREARGLSLESTAHRTLVRASILQAIEAGQLEQLPEPVYIQGFIRRFAEALELDADRVTEAFPLGQDKPTQQSWFRHHFPSAQLRPIHLYGIYLLVIAGSVHSLSWLMTSAMTQASAPLRAQQSEVLAKAVERSLSKSNSVGNGPVAQAFPIGSSLPIQGNSADAISRLSSRLAQASQPQPQPQVSDKPVQVKLTLTAQSWLRVTVDGQEAYEGVLAQGDERVWEANEAVVVRAGNAGGVMVALNAQPAKPMGIPGAVEEVTYGANQSSNQTAALEFGTFATAR